MARQQDVRQHEGKALLPSAFARLNGKSAVDLRLQRLRYSSGNQKQPLLRWRKVGIVLDRLLTKFLLKTLDNPPRFFVITPTTTPQQNNPLKHGGSDFSRRLFAFASVRVSLQRKEPLMNSIVPSTLSNAPTTRKTETPSSDANQPQLKFAEKSCTVTKLVDELVAAKQKEAASPFGIDDLRSHLTIFGKRFGSQPVATITIAEIDDWLRSLNVSIVTRNHYRQSIMQAFGFAVKHGYANFNPVFGRFVVSRPC